MKNLLLLIITLAIAIAGSAVAQSPKGAEQQKAKSAPAATSNVDGKFTVLSSHIKSIGTIGKTGRYEIVSARLRGLDSPNISALLAYDSVTDSLGVLASGVEPGLGVAIVNGGAQVGSSFLFGSKLRPDRTSVNNNSDSDSDADSDSDSDSYSRSEGGDAVSVSKSQGGSAVSVSNADARNSNSNSNTSVNSNQQSQGQLQGQVQGQSNKNHNKASAPKKSKKSRKH